MSMHMIRGVQVHGKGKRKSKKLDMEKVELEWRRYNKDMRRKHMHNCQFEKLDDYVNYIQGTMPKQKRKFKSYEPTKSHERNTTQYPSSTAKTSDSVPTHTPKRESQKYTGDLIVGIGVMHKSNLVPIMRGTDEAKDIANMRR